jgi:hypothetical protein
MPAKSVLIRHVLGACAAAIILTVIGAFSLWVQQPLLAASLGSAVFIQTLTPGEKSGRLWPTGIGQLAGVAGGLIGVILAHAEPAPMFMAAQPLVVARVLAACLAVLVTGCLQGVLKAVSPAGAATALILALGMEAPDWLGIVRLMTGIALVTVLGEAARQMLLRENAKRREGLGIGGPSIIAKPQTRSDAVNPSP